MAVFDAIGEFFLTIIFEGLFYDVPIGIYEWITGKEIRGHSYRTQQRKFIKFSVAEKLVLIWETDINHLRNKFAEGLELIDEKLKLHDIEFITLDDKTIVRPPLSISFYAFIS